MRLVIYEDSLAANFSPLATLRPTFELRCGHFSTRERALRYLPVTDWAFAARPELNASLLAASPEAAAFHAEWLSAGPVWFLNGRWLASREDYLNLDEEAVGLVDGEIAWMCLRPEEADLFRLGLTVEEGIAAAARHRRRLEAGGVLARFPWDLVNQNPTQIEWDHAARLARVEPSSAGDSSRSALAITGPADRVWIDLSADVEPFVSIDVRGGPVWIEAGVKIQSFTRIEGPAWIGRQTQLFRTNLRGGTSIGPVCRVGGEIEASILHGYVNKYHDGFLGHAYVCPWVNLGALTTNSDLKNDYSAVRVPLSGTPIDSGSTKVGCFLGDHVKTAIGTLFNTGTSVGVMAMVLPNGELAPKWIPPFTRLWHGELTPVPDIDRQIAIARTVLGRRNVELNDADEALLRLVWQRELSKPSHQPPLVTAKS